jgi:hypothetical protein
MRVCHLCLLFLADPLTLRHDRLYYLAQNYTLVMSCSFPFDYCLYLNLLFEVDLLSLLEQADGSHAAHINTYISQAA